MCGIAGLVAPPGATPSPQTLAAMGDAMAHRGPDDATVAVHGRAGLSFRRLSIIDVAGGAQPIANEDGTCHVILNGEIYNHLDLRAELLASGHRFRTRSDVEVVVHGYEEWGDAVVPRLRGMFALALWDGPKQRLLLARDRLGEKPLVYCERGGGLAFASELQALLRDPEVPRAPDLLAIHDYLTYQYVPAPRTAFAGVSKLPPGHTLVFEDGHASVQRYWSPRTGPPLAIARADAVVELRRLLRDAVRVRLMSEVPLGAFLSGGVDSSAVVALMAEAGRVKTFSIGFVEKGFDELPFAREVAARYGTDHHEFVVEPHAAEVLPRLVEHYGEPFGDSSALPTYYLARLTREHVTVALSGDGGDELFAGYDRYRALRAYALLARLPVGAFAARGVASALPRAAPARLRRFLEAVSADPIESYGRTVSYFSAEEKQALYTPAMRAAVGARDPFALLAEAADACGGEDLLARVIGADMLTYLPGDLLAKVDIATMASSLEARAPLIDHPLVEFAARLPSSMKLGKDGSKSIFREAVADLLPASVQARPKMGFGVPVGAWFRGELRPMLHDVLLSPRAQARGWLRPEAVRALVAAHERGGRDHGPQLYALLALEMWASRVLDAPPPRHALEPALAAPESAG